MSSLTPTHHATPCEAWMAVLPGRLLVTVLLRVGSALSALVFPPQDLLHGLRAAQHALSFAEVLREDWHPEELLPWAGNV